MNYSLATAEACPDAAEKSDRFRHQFKRALSLCMRKGFSLDECFEVIWEETSRDVDLDGGEQNAMRQELLHWSQEFNPPIRLSA